MISACISLVGAIVLLWLAYVAFFKPEKFWQWQERSNRQQGIINSQPAEEWQKSRETGGCLAFLFGVLILIFAIYLFVQDVTFATRLNDAAQRVSQTRLPVILTAEARLLGDLEEQYDSLIQELLTRTPVPLQQLTRNDFQLPYQTNVFYGDCDGQFFLVASVWYESYLYLHHGEVQKCASESWLRSRPDFLGNDDYNGKWYRVEIVESMIPDPNQPPKVK